MVAGAGAAEVEVIDVTGVTFSPRAPFTARARARGAGQAGRVGAVVNFLAVVDAVPVGVGLIGIRVVEAGLVVVVETVSIGIFSPRAIIRVQGIGLELDLLPVARTVTVRVRIVRVGAVDLRLVVIE